MSNSSVLNEEVPQTQPLLSLPPSKAQAELLKLAESYTIREIEAEVAKGKKAVWGGMGWELPLVYACDTTPISVLELTREDSRGSEAIAESEHLVPVEFCSVVKSIIGKLSQRKHNDPIKRVLWFSSICESTNIAFELTRKYGYDVHSLDAVNIYKLSDKRPEVIQHLVNKLQNVAIWLTGKPVDEDRLRWEIRRSNEITAKIRRVMELRLNNPVYLGSFQVLMLMMGYFNYYGNADRFAKILDDLAEELEVAAKYHDPDSYIPLVLTGIFLGGPALFDVVEKAGGSFVAWEIFSTRDYREDVPPLESLAHYLLDGQIDGISMAGAGVHLRKHNVERLLEQTKAKGIVSGSLTLCPIGSVAPQIERQYFKQHGVPYINIETDVHPEPPTEEQVTRLTSFIEMLS
jgi:benzoyl-CoA reductase/2-hydroxyglutaryl-CoA dehydratase subunit BcrC/BadD/HgdB